jgi:sterol 3beta-glucosyltransferase
VPAFWAVPFPGQPATGAFPNVAFPALPLGRRYNRWTHLAGNAAMQALTGRFFNQWRRQRLGLEAMPFGSWPYGRLHGRPLPILYSFSARVFPPAPEWGEQVHLAGYWTLEPPPGWQPPAGLLDFLSAGPPPVYIGFGSMNSRDPRRAAQIVQQALAQSGQRGVIAAGWGGLAVEGLPAGQVFTLEAIPHAWLFPRMAAVVHHGGSGTTGAGLCAGVPSILVPHAGDQGLWARRVLELGVGPPSIPRRELTAVRLAEAITAALTDEEMQQRAAALGERLRAEDGLARAVAIIDAV